MTEPSTEAASVGEEGGSGYIPLAIHESPHLLTYWQGTVDARLMVIEASISSALSNANETRIALEGALRRTHEDICIELREISRKLNRSDALSNKMLGAVAVILFTVNLAMPWLIKLILH